MAKTPFQRDEETLRAMFEIYCKGNHSRPSAVRDATGNHSRPSGACDAGDGHSRGPGARDFAASHSRPSAVRDAACVHSRPSVMCDACNAVFTYSMERTAKCPHQHKGNCSECTIHCYAPAMRAEIKAVMKYAGPRMMFLHPLLTIRYCVRKISGKRALRREKRAALGQ